MWVWRRLAIIIILSFAGSISAQEWTVWLYQLNDGLLLHLDSHGNVRDTRIIPIDDGYDVPHSVVFSHDQTLMATVATAGNSFRHRLTLYQMDSETVIFVFELPALDDVPFNKDDQLLLTKTAFSQNDEQLAFVSFIGGIGWTIHIADTETGDITHTLPYDHPQVLQQPYLKSADIPQLVRLQDNMLSFYINNVAGNPSPQGHSYAWFLIPDQVRETIAFPNANHDTLATGEAVYPLPDTRFQSDNETIPVIRPHHNVVYVYQTGDESRFPSIARPELDLLQTWFIQGGERLLVEAWEDEIRTRWLIYDRNGREVRNLPQAGYDVTATKDGFLYLTELNDKTILVHVDSRTFSTGGDTVWVEEGDWQIVSVTEAVNDNLLPFAQLEKAETPPPYITDATLQPTAFPTPMPLVYIGREMQLQVDDDGYINLRAEPTTNGEVLALLENGLYVDIVEGPIESGIYTWWKVRLGGREGWLVEAIEGSQILIPRLPIIDDETAEATDEPD